MDIVTLKKIAKLLNENHIAWGLGASSMLYFHGLVDQPRDIDLMIDEEDALKAAQLLKAYASHIQTDDGKGKYATKYFYEMVIDGQDVDMIGGYRIMRGDWIYDFPRIKGMKLDEVECDGVKIPLTRLEDWFVAYLIMNDPKSRVPLIEAFVRDHNGFKHRDRIKAAYDQIAQKAAEEKALMGTLKKWINTPKA